MRTLGVPTVADRVAQTVVRMYLEPEVEPLFHPDSYGYRPGRSALDAVGQCRKRCWKHDWVIDLDLRAFFDSIDHDLLLKAVSKHTDLPLGPPLRAAVAGSAAATRGRHHRRNGIAGPRRVLRSRRCWLTSSSTMRSISWMAREFPGCPFERYADDAVVHCDSEAEARLVLAALAERMAQVGLELHPDKTRIVYCKDADRRGSHEHERFDFLGYTFRPRLSKNKLGKHFVNFSPAVCDDARKAISREIRSWHITRRSDKTLSDLARMFNPIVRGWINYYGRFYKSWLYPVLRHINDGLVRWAMRKYKRLRGHHPASEGMVGDGRSTRAGPLRPLEARATRRLGDGSRMSGDVHVRFCESRGVRFPPATHLVVLCSTREQAEEAERRSGALLGDLGLRLHPDKTRVVDLREGKEGFDFLGCHFRARMSGKLWQQKRIIRYYLHRWPSVRSMKRARARVKALTARSQVGAQLPDVIGRLNRFLRGWGNYFRTGNATFKFIAMDRYVSWRLKRLLVMKRGRNLRPGQATTWSRTWFHDQGLHKLMGTVRYPKAA